MRVSDLVIQYQNNLAAGSEVSTGTKGVEQLVETAKALLPGNIFEGTVNNIRGTQVILGLSSGQNITARLDKGVSLSKGQSVFFQVKANDGAQVQIKPISLGGENGNPTLMKALDAANLPINEKYLNMVNTMMKEQMSIDAKSLQEMSRQVIQSQASNAATVVEMVKLDIPVTPGNILQYESYKKDEGEVLSQINRLADDLSAAMQSEENEAAQGVELHGKIIRFFAGNTQGEAAENSVNTKNTANPQTEHAAAQALNETAQAGAEDTVSLQRISENAKKITVELLPQEEYPKNTIGAVLHKESFAGLQEALSEFPEFIRDKEAFFDEHHQLKPETSVKDFLKNVAEFLESGDGKIDREKSALLFGNKGYKALLSHLITEQWTIEPEQLKQEHSVRNLYRNMNEQLQTLQQLVSGNAKANETVSGAIQNLTQNIDFMNQINQTYAYVQVPLRLTGQNVNSELFVYKNKKTQKSEDEPLTAFLHFDMEYLGGVDISVKMLQKNVTTSWYLDSEDTLELLSQNIHFLQEKLEEKGYHCEMSFQHAADKKNFVEDFLKADAKTGGEVHRYSFDVRA